MPEITITSKRDGFRRCGVAHRDVPVTWPDGSFTDEQIAILRAEPALVVHLGAVSGDDDKLKIAQGRIQELEAVVLQLNDDAAGLKSQLAEVTADRDRLQEALTAASSASVSEVKENAADDTAAAESSAKAKK
ncbi:HI1506-related protein [Klebsiella pneumoniae]|uniref:HI1506-related protein n=1 Tax=Klebsiella pneumoniae TaxID=573 RepID=UPI00298C830B|nr:HI1506-related protein [Klebsiella pneumoniae]MDW5947722.1 HI1506-related protein [Klebsiella pneumoniae]MDW5958163.1 HI1506-related protein [Klebsiella pneumoniae]MDW6010164.1 HI1506-related protein [Klebsiella pneumoniae]MDW6026897.1 HI1506-related protein [Klebsiella pneumoniae]MDW6131854.1 HI1506-related protein [Klebsiella pneumoniae]